MGISVKYTADIKKEDFNVEIYFDDCTEHLLKEYEALKPEEREQAQKLFEELQSFKKDCLKTGVCPEGELIRGYICRQFLRDAVKRMWSKLSDFNNNDTIKSFLYETEKFIETVDEEKEHIKAYIVVRNLTVIAENIASQEKKGVLPVVPKQSIFFRNCHITKKGLDELCVILAFKRGKDFSKLLSGKGLPPMIPRQYNEIRYRHLFFNVLSGLIEVKETV